MSLSRFEKYEILNRIQPYFEKSKYPYNRITFKKVKFTQKEIDLYLNNDNFFTTEKNKNNTGGNELSKIIVYFYSF